MGNLPVEVILPDAIKRLSARLVAAGGVRPVLRCVLCHAGASREGDAREGEEDKQRRQAEQAVHGRTFRAAKFLGKGNHGSGAGRCSVPISFNR